MVELLYLEPVDVFLQGETDEVAEDGKGDKAKEDAQPDPAVVVRWGEWWWWWWCGHGTARALCLGWMGWVGGRERGGRGVWVGGHVASA